MKHMDRGKMFWSGTAAVFGSLLLLGFVAPPSSGGELPGGQHGSQLPPQQEIPPEDTTQQFTCADGETRDMAITVAGSEFTAVGELTTISENGMTVRALPGQLVLAPPMEGSAAHGYLAGDVVIATGVITADGTYQALTIAPACGGVLVTEITPVPTAVPPPPPVVQEQNDQTEGDAVLAVNPGDADAVAQDEDDNDRGRDDKKDKHDDGDDDDDDDDDDEGGDDD